MTTIYSWLTGAVVVFHLLLIIYGLIGRSWTILLYLPLVLWLPLSNLLVGFAL